MQKKVQVIIEMKDVVANAFICAIMAGKSRKLFWFKLDDYARAWVRKLMDVYGVEATYYVSDAEQDGFVESYPEYFASERAYGCNYIVLKEGVTAMDLWNKFCASLSGNMLAVFPQVWQEVNERSEQVCAGI